MLVLCLFASVHAFSCGVLVCLCSLCLWRSVFLLALCMSLLCALQCLHHLMLQLPCCRGTNVFAFGCWACVAVLGLRATLGVIGVSHHPSLFFPVCVSSFRSSLAAARTRDHCLPCLSLPLALPCVAWRCASGSSAW